MTEDVVRITHYMYFEEPGGFASFSRHIYPRKGLRFFRDSVTLSTGVGDP